MPGIETAHDAADKAVDATKELAALKQMSEVEIDQYLETPPEFFQDGFNMNDFVDWIFDGGMDISDFTEEALAELPEGEYHKAYERLPSQKGLGPIMFEEETGGIKYKTRPKLDSEGNEVTAPETNEKVMEYVPAYKGHLEHTYGWSKNFIKVLAQKPRKVGVRIPQTRHKEFIIAMKPKINSMLKKMGREDALLEEGHAKMGGVRRALEIIAPLKTQQEKKVHRLERAKKLKQKAITRKEAEIKALKKEVEEAEFRALGEKNRRKEDELTRKMIDRNRGSGTQRQAIIQEAEEAGLLKPGKEHKAE